MLQPEIRVTPDRLKSGGSVMMTGTGFTPNRSVVSHLLRPDESEYNPLRLRANAKGEIAHQISSVMLQIGRHELWVEDEATQVVSNHVRFTVE